ncbi:hypothetical protein BGX28_001620, partial [Mortierella sp. GBA30]
MLLLDPLNDSMQEVSQDGLWRDLNTLMLIERRDDADGALHAFWAKYRGYQSFLNYFNTQWLNNGNINITMWMKAFRLDVEHGGMDTTNMLESWHRKLKYDHFGGRPNRRRDVLIHMLYQVGDADIEHQ